MQTQMITILAPPTGEAAYSIAAQEFAAYWQKVTGQTVAVTKASKQMPSGDLIVIGADVVNPIAFGLLKRGDIKTFNLRFGTDDYQILTLRETGRTILILAGGTGRSTIYAVYDFFRLAAGVEYFWDGERVKKNTSFAIPTLDVKESPRFVYRGLRYFAHRGLHRFQAEHWDLTDWKREIDWIMKKRMNIFMLRTGIDDLFQRAFDLPYPPEDGPDPDRVDRSFNDRTSLWSLKARGELRKQVLQYAFDRGLLHPADTGTITHWYSHTPSSFYERFPDFPLLSQTSGSYAELKGAAIWDTEDQRAWDAYWKLTETSISEFGQEQSRLFHTIGLAERSFGVNSDENFRIKTSALRKIQQEVQQRYPDAPFLLAGWDLWQRWKNDDVQRMLKELNPEKVLVLDYTVDDLARKTYKDWGTYQKYPWIFGVFHAFASENEIRNDYTMLAERVKEAANDDLCKGFVFWPELSHSDTFMLEYLAENSWNPSTPTQAHAIKRFCTSRYSGNLVLKMRKIWKDTLSITRHSQWSKLKVPSRGHFSVRAYDEEAERLIFMTDELEAIDQDLVRAKGVISALATLAGKHAADVLWKRDAIDIVRSILSVVLHAEFNRGAINLSAWRKQETSADSVTHAVARVQSLIDVLADLLEHSSDFSLYASMLRLAEYAPINPHTELTLKSNTENGYCRTQIYELVRYLFVPEMQMYADWVADKLVRGDRTAPEEIFWFIDERKLIKDAFYAKPLTEMAPRKTDSSAAELRDVLNQVAEACR